MSETPLIDPTKLERLLKRTDALPSCPLVFQKINEIVRDESSTARDLGRVIATDEALTSRLIQIVNSAYYGLRGTISTVTQAVVILGFQEIKRIVYAVPAADLFRQSEVDGGIDVMGLWLHSLRVAVGAREFAYRARLAIPEETFVAGIIHDIGQVILNRLVGPAYAEFGARARAEGADLAAAEEAAFGISHAEVGRRLAKNWDFPELLQDAVRWHHGPLGDRELPDVVHMVHAANVLVNEAARGVAPADAVASVEPAAIERLDLNRGSAEEVFGRAEEEFARMREMFRIAGPDDETIEIPSPGRVE